MALSTALVIGIVIASIYRFTASSSSEFIITLAVMPMLIGSVIMIVNGNLGLYANDAYHFTYRGVPIGVSDWDWTDNRQRYQFYFSQKKDANIFYNQLAADIKKAGIPLTPDKIYGGLSNRRRPVSIFRWVYLTPPALVKEADHSNLDREDVVGMYKVELGVYKRKKR